MIYFDNASTTKISDNVLSAMIPYLRESYGNPGSQHKLGARSHEAVETARKAVADFVGSSPEQIIFTSGGSEANNLALLGVKMHLMSQMKTHIIVSEIEHHSTLEAVKYLHDFCFFDVDYVMPDKTGVVTADAVKALMRDDTGLVCVMYVNNELGSENQVEEIGALCREQGCLFMCDAVQAAGTFKINVECLNCDFLSISSHKIHGPKGTGALYCREKGLLRPLIHGGAEQEYGLRGGTENVANIVGFGAACDEIMDMSDTIQAQIKYIKRSFLECLREHLDRYHVKQYMHINANCDTRTGKILSLTFDGVDAETLLMMMDLGDVCASAGSACNSTEQVPSHVLKAIGMTDEQARSTIRFSFSEYNIYDNIDHAAEVVAECVSTLRQFVTDRK